MKEPQSARERLLSRAGRDAGFRERLIADPKGAIERELGATLAEGHEIHVHEDSDRATHLVLPPRSRQSEEEREAARTGVASLEFLRKTMHDPAPPLRPPGENPAAARLSSLTLEALAREGKASIRRGLRFLESTIDENGAWHCIRFNIADPNVPRHFERPAFISALCTLALESSGEERARAMCARTRSYLIDTMEYPGLWRYYRHLPQDLDSTALSSLAVGNHPWVLLGRNIPAILANRDEQGRFLTWVLAEGEPDVVPRFRIEADPVVNANVIAYLGNHPGTVEARAWLEAMIAEDRLTDSSKWYPDKVTVYYATSRAMAFARPALDRLRPMLADRTLALLEEDGQSGDILHTAQAVSALHNVGSLVRIDVRRMVGKLVGAQREDGSWPELLAFGDKALKWGVMGQFGHGSEAVTSAFCIEALAHLVETLTRPVHKQAG